MLMNETGTVIVGVAGEGREKQPPGYYILSVQLSISHMEHTSVSQGVARSAVARF
jgi:hypothetical protein